MRGQVGTKIQPMGHLPSLVLVRLCQVSEGMLFSNTCSRLRGELNICVKILFFPCPAHIYFTAKRKEAGGGISPLPSLLQVVSSQWFQFLLDRLT